jgi:hypothetical protein
MKLYQQISKLTFLLALLALTAEPISAFYDPSGGRWINRDPLVDTGFALLHGFSGIPLTDGPNLYAFIQNSPTLHYDLFGLASCTYSCVRTITIAPIYICALKVDENNCEDCHLVLLIHDSGTGFRIFFRLCTACPGRLPPPGLLPKA